MLVILVKITVLAVSLPNFTIYWIHLLFFILRMPCVESATELGIKYGSLWLLRLSLLYNYSLTYLVRCHLKSLVLAGDASATLFSIWLRQETSTKIFRLGLTLLLAWYCLVRVPRKWVLRISHENKVIMGIIFRFYRLLLESLRRGKCVLISRIFDRLLRMVI
jgi:hypothetical protein